MRPPTASARARPGWPAPGPTSSPLTSMRSAWKMRLAGLPPVRWAACGRASRISSTSRALLMKGSFGALAHDRGDDPLGQLLLAVRSRIRTRSPGGRC